MVALLVGATAPARAWCEASCVAPAHHAGESAMPHCPAHDATSGTKITAATNADCPVVEAARPTQLRLETQHVRIVAPSLPRTSAPSDLRTPSPSHFRALAPPRLITPLRI